MYTVLSCAVILLLCISETIVQSCMDTLTDSDEEGQPFKKCGSSKNVGIISPLIINGTEAQLGSFPWHAGLYYRKVNNGAESWEQGCAGSLITDRFVLTAAHCVTDVNETDVRVALGKIYQSWDEDECSQQKRNVSKITYPFEFHRQTYYFDIALLLLDEKVKLGELVMPVCTGLQGGSDYLLNQQLFVVGWGQTQDVFIGSDSETLLYNDAMFIPQRDCQRFVAPWFALFDKFCIRKNNSPESVIQRGDSGGGLTVVNEGLHYIFGIVSVKYNGRNHQTSLITNVTWLTHINWIENQIRKYDTSYSWYGDETAAKDSSSETIVQSYMDTHTDSDKDGQPFKKCGVSKHVGRIINGTEAQLASFPWHAGLYYRHEENGVESWVLRCGGSLITDRFVLTAARCMERTNNGTNVRVALGKIYSSWDIDESSQQKRNVLKSLYSSDYNRWTFFFNIALLLLDEKIKLGELVMPVCTGLQGGLDYLFNQQLFIPGLAQTQNLNRGSGSDSLFYIDWMVIPRNDCQKSFPKFYYMVDKFCIRKNNSVESVAKPDEIGTGLTVANEGLHYIFGIVSSFGHTGKDYKGNIVANLTWYDHIEWIENEIRKYDTSYSWYGHKTATNDISSETIVQSCMVTRTGSDKDGQPFKKCGISKHVGRIINGTEAQLGSFPWHALLYYRHEKNGVESWVQKCKGSLITDQFVLTTADCVMDVNEADVRVTLGKIYQSGDEDEGSEQKRYVLKSLYSSDFNSWTFFFNIALLLLDEKVKLGELVMPVCTGLQGGLDYLVNQQLFIPGLAQTQNLNSGKASDSLFYNDLMVIPRNDCRKSVYSHIDIIDKFCIRKNNSVESPISKPEEFGTGLTVVNEGLHYIFGIVCLLITRKEFNKGNLVANLTWYDHIEWIENQIRKYDPCYSWYGDKTATKVTSRVNIRSHRFFIDGRGLTFANPNGQPFLIGIASEEEIGEPVLIFADITNVDSIGWLEVKINRIRQSHREL